MSSGRTKNGIKQPTSGRVKSPTPKKTATGRLIQQPPPNPYQQLKLAGVENLSQTQGMLLEIEHLPTGHYVEFPAFIDSFSDAYNSEWSSEQVYGRMDPIATFQSTRRAISVSWMIPAESAETAVENLARINTLLSFLYPLYEAGRGANINMAPLLRIKFGNLMQDSVTGGGLLGYVNGFTMDPEMDAGMFVWGMGYNDDGVNGVEYYPKAIRLNFEMTVLHEHSLGWVRQGSDYVFRNGNAGGFPYGTTPPVDVGDLPDMPATPPRGKNADGSTSGGKAKRVEPNSPAAAKSSGAKILEGTRKAQEGTDEMIIYSGGTWMSETYYKSMNPE